MEVIRVSAHIDANGHIEVDDPDLLPFGDVMITIEPISPGDEAVDDAHWEKSLADPRSKGLLAKMAAKARANRDAGLNQELDLDTL